MNTETIVAIVSASVAVLSATYTVVRDLRARPRLTASASWMFDPQSGKHDLTVFPINSGKAPAVVKSVTARIGDHGLTMTQQPQLVDGPGVGRLDVFPAPMLDDVARRSGASNSDWSVVLETDSDRIVVPVAAKPDRQGARRNGDVRPAD